MTEIIDVLRHQIEDADIEFRIIFAFFLIVSAVALLLIALVPRRPTNVPPGPPSRLPLLGNMLELVRDPDVRANLIRLRRRYGDVYSLQMGTKTVVVLSGYDVMKETLLKRADVFSGRPSCFFFDNFLGKQGIVATSGPLWKEHRTFAIKSLRNLGFGKSSLEDKIHDQIIELLKEIDHRSSLPFNVERLLSTSIANVISAVSFGGKYKNGDKKFNYIFKLVDEIVGLVGFASLINFLPFLSYLPVDLLGAKRVLKNYRVIEKYLKSEIQRHIDDNSRGEEATNTFVGAYIQEMKRKESDPDSSFTIDQLASVLFEFVTAGTQTVTTAIHWALIYLVNFPEIQETISREIDYNVGRDRLPSLQDRKNLVFTEAFIMETLRHGRMGALSLPHGVSEDVNIREFRIPKNAIVLIDLYSTMHDPDVWTEPAEFKPERFIDSEGRLIKPEQYIPFAIGRRICPAESFAKMELFLFMSALVQNFQFQAPSEEDLSFVALDGVFGAAHKPKPHNIVAVPRASSRKILA